MEDITELIKESNTLLNKMYSSVDESKKISSQEELRNEVSSFIVAQLNRIQKQDILRGLIEAELSQKIVLHELSTAELRDLYATISKEKTVNTTALLDIFKPTNTTPNSLVTPPVKENEDSGAIEYTASQRQSLAKLAQIVEALESRKEKSE